MAINEERQLGRAKNATMAFLERRLSVPKIYIDALWDGHKIDVLAIDRDGVGDVHAVLIFISRYFPDGMPNILDEAQQARERIQRFEAIPAQYKYVGSIEVDGDRRNSRQHEVSKSLLNMSFAPDGVGRIGFLRIHIPSEGEPSTVVEVKPERFRAKIAKLADDYIAQHTPDWEIRA